MNFRKFVNIIILALMLLSFDLPLGWVKAGNKPNSYEMGIEKDLERNGNNVATIKSIKDNIEGFGSLMQNILPGNFIGNRIKMTGYMKTKDVADWAGFWLRVDEFDNSQPLSFDNMGNRSIKGTNDWTKYEIVVDVPLSSSNIAFGALLSGTGQIWFDNIEFEIVDNTVPTTGNGNQHLMPNNVPTNLDFEKF